MVVLLEQEVESSCGKTMGALGGKEQLLVRAVGRCEPAITVQES
jgi:hypothetical protein